MSINSKESSLLLSCFVRSMQSNRGFTLIELLVVIVILGILATLSLLGISDFKDKTKTARASAEIRGLEKDIISYASEKGSYPPDANAPGMEVLKTLKDPWGNAYVYSITPTRTWVGFLNTDFDLYSKGQTGNSTDASVASILLGNGADDIIRGGDGSYAGAAANYP